MLVQVLQFTELAIKHCSVCHIPAPSLRFKQTQSLHMYAVVATTGGALEENGGKWGNRKPPEHDKTRVLTGDTRKRSEKSCCACKAKR